MRTTHLLTVYAFSSHQMSAARGPQVNKFEQVSSLHHQGGLRQVGAEAGAEGGSLYS